MGIWGWDFVARDGRRIMLNGGVHLWTYTCIAKIKCYMQEISFVSVGTLMIYISLSMRYGFI